MAKIATSEIVRIIERAAIEDMVHLYAKNVRDGRGMSCGELFTLDAVFEVRQAPVFGSASYIIRSKILGREAISAHIARSAGHELQICPAISNLMVALNGSAAVSTCLMTNLASANGSQTLGEYHDAYRKRGGRWLFSERIFTIVDGV